MLTIETSECKRNEIKTLEEVRRQQRSTKCRETKREFCMLWYLFKRILEPSTSLVKL